MSNLSNNDIFGIVTLRRKGDQIIAICDFNIHDTVEAAAVMQALSDAQKQLINGTYKAIMKQ